MSEIERLESRAYKTYKARLAATERLQARQRAWNTILLALSLATTAASIALLTEPQMYGAAGPTVLVCISVLALVASLAVAGLDYGVRSRNMFMNYRGLQQLSMEAENFNLQGNIDEQTLQKLWSRYNSLLDDSENHTTADYASINGGSEVGNWHRRASLLVTLSPYIALVVPVLVLLPLVQWVLRDGKL